MLFLDNSVYFEKPLQMLPEADPLPSPDEHGQKYAISQLCFAVAIFLSGIRILYVDIGHRHRARGGCLCHSTIINAVLTLNTSLPQF